MTGVSPRRRFRRFVEGARILLHLSRSNLHGWTRRYSFFAGLIRTDKFPSALPSFFFTKTTYFIAISNPATFSSSQMVTSVSVTLALLSTFQIMQLKQALWQILSLSFGDAPEQPYTWHLRPWKASITVSRPTGGLLALLVTIYSRVLCVVSLFSWLPWLTKISTLGPVQSMDGWPSLPELNLLSSDWRLIIMWDCLFVRWVTPHHNHNHERDSINSRPPAPT